jgi:hypothetical protein
MPFLLGELQEIDRRDRRVCVRKMIGEIHAVHEEAVGLEDARPFAQNSDQDVGRDVLQDGIRNVVVDASRCQRQVGGVRGSEVPNPRMVQELRQAVTIPLQQGFETLAKEWRSRMAAE